MRAFKSFIRDTSGATAIEYGLIASLVAVGLVSILGTVGWRVQTVFWTLQGALK